MVISAKVRLLAQVLLSRTCISRKQGIFKVLKSRGRDITRRGTKFISKRGRKHGSFYKVGQFYHKVGKVFANQGNQNKAEQYICYINILKWSNDCAYLSWPLVIIYKRE